jgi:hypothetical protein
MRDMVDRLDNNEQRQNTIISFLARLAQNPTVLQQMVTVAEDVGLQRSLNDGRNGGEQWAVVLGFELQLSRSACVSIRPHPIHVTLKGARVQKCML